MEFKQKTDMVAWADQSLYQTFAGPAMQKGDFWKIHFGRCIELDDDDLDGSQFLEDLLEDALLFPLRSDLSHRTHERWETVEESPGMWVTRPMASLEVELDDDTDDADDNSSDYDEHGGLDESMEARAKLEMRDWVYQQSDAIRADAYKTDEDEGEADEEVEDEAQDDVQMSDPGWSFNPRGADVAWPTGLKNKDVDGENVKENEGGEDGERIERIADHNSNEDEEEYGNMEVGDFEQSSVADSDFDSDEVLSGDEDIIAD